MVCLQLTACSSELANFSGLFRRELFRDSTAISLCAFEGISMQNGRREFSEWNQELRREWMRRKG